MITLSQWSHCWVTVIAAVAAWLLLKAKAAVTIPVVLNNSVVRCTIKAHSCSKMFQWPRWKKACWSPLSHSTAALIKTDNKFSGNTRTLSFHWMPVFCHFLSSSSLSAGSHFFCRVSTIVLFDHNQGEQCLFLFRPCEVLCISFSQFDPMKG